MQKDSPEERLLRLIKGEPKKIDTPAQKFLLQNKILKAPLLKIVNKVLFAILLTASIYFVYSLLFEGKKPAFYVSQLEGIPVEKGQGLESGLKEVEDYSVYDKEITGKQLFIGSSQGPDAGIGLQGTDMSKRFNLVGIITGDNPQAIIEDRDVGKTYYLYKGQSINGATVIDISEGKAILNYGGREIVLVM